MDGKDLIQNIKNAVDVYKSLGEYRIKRLIVQIMLFLVCFFSFQHVIKIPSSVADFSGILHQIFNLTISSKSFFLWNIILQILILTIPKFVINLCFKLKVEENKVVALSITSSRVLRFLHCVFVLYFSLVSVPLSGIDNYVMIISMITIFELSIRILGTIYSGYYNRRLGEPTFYYDTNGKRICIGDYIRFKNRVYIVNSIVSSEGRKIYLSSSPFSSTPSVLLDDAIRDDLYPIEIIKIEW